MFNYFQIVGQITADVPLSVPLFFIKIVLKSNFLIEQDGLQIGVALGITNRGKEHNNRGKWIKNRGRTISTFKMLVVRVHSICYERKGNRNLDQHQDDSYAKDDRQTNIFTTER